MSQRRIVSKVVDSTAGKLDDSATRDLIWTEVHGNQRAEFRFEGIGHLQKLELRDMRRLPQKVADSFMSRFFPVGYPQSVSEGYMSYTKYRALQHWASAALHVLSTQSLLFAAGLRPTPAQATIVSWVLKDGMQHVGKLVCSSMGPRMDAEPKRWRMFADIMYDVGAGLEVILPMCPQHFLGVAGVANMAKGMALVSARSTRLPIYTSFARESNLSDLYAKGEAISTLSNCLGLALGIRLASTVCASTQGKILVAPVLSAIHLYAVSQEMRAAPVSTLDAQRTALIIASFLETGEVPRPAELRYKERIILPVQTNKKAGAVHVGAPLHSVARSPSDARALIQRWRGERFLLRSRGGGEKDGAATEGGSSRCEGFDLVLHKKATGKDAVRAWLLAAYAHRLSSEGGSTSVKEEELWSKAHARADRNFPSLWSGLLEKGWHTGLFLDGSGYRAVW